MSDECAIESGEETLGGRFTLSSYEPVEIIMPTLVIPEADIDDQLLQIAQRYTTHEKVEDREIRPHDHLFISIESTLGGEPFPALSGEGNDYKLDEGLMSEEFEQQIRTMSVGETKTFEFEGPTMDTDEDGQPIMGQITSTVTVLEIREPVIPAITDAWVSENVPEISTVPEFRELLRGEMEAQVVPQYEQYKNHICGSVLGKRLEGDIPEELFEKDLAGFRTNFEMALSQQGLTKDDVLAQQGLTEEQFEEQMLKEVREMATQGLALDAMAAHLGFEVDDDEINAVFGGQTPEQTAAARQACEEAGRLEDARKGALRGKTLRWLVETAKVEYVEA